MRPLHRHLAIALAIAGTTGCTPLETAYAVGVAAQVLTQQAGRQPGTPAGPLGTPSPGVTPAPSRTAAPGSLPLPLPSVAGGALPLPGLPGPGGTPSAAERELFDLINAYRGEKGLPPVPLSPSLTLVAQAHVKDLQENTPDAGEDCNLHSWSDKGTWSAVCYTGDHAKASGMWDKPRELTRYPGNGYEIAYKISGASVTPAAALKGWQGSAGHNGVMINLPPWKDTTWNAMGVGISKNYAVVWFGKEPDPVAP